MTLLDVALDCLRRGWYVFPCVPKDKRPLGGLVPHGYLDASNDEDTIRRWWKAKPDANVAIACGASNLTVADCDHGLTTEAEARAWIERANLPETYAVHTGRRLMKDGSGRPEYGIQLYYSKAIPGSGTFNIEGGSGEIQSRGDYVMAAGSIHPDSGEAYAPLIDAPIVPVPEWIEKLTPLKQAGDAAATVSDAKADDWKTWLLEYADHNQIALRDYEKREPNGWWLGIKCPWEHRSGDGVDSSTVLGVLDGKIAFECSHGTCKAAKRDTAVFKAEMLRLNGEFKPEPGADPMVILGSKLQVTDADEFELVGNTARPVYPDRVWEGTAYGEFADYCSDGNYIPKRFFSEALRTVVGSVVGGQLSTDFQGVNARAYTVLIGPPGSGKGTAITAARRFVEGDFDSQTRSSERPLLWDDIHDPQNWCWPSRYIGAHVVSPASAPGLIQATKPRKLEKGESRNPMEQWREVPRFITIQEEIGGLFANFANENSGRGLETAILELYDRDSFTTTATNDRPAKSGRLLYSILGGIPKTEWDNIFVRASSVGSGLLSRLNIVGTENERTVAGLPEYDFAEMQRRFLPRISGLERTQARIPLSANGRALLNEWFTRISEDLKNKEVPSARLNTHALRVALHLAWLHGHANISESDVDAGIKVADFQAKMREFYLPAEGETREAQWEARIMKAMRAKRSLTYRELQKTVGAARAGTAVWERAIAGLKRDKRIAVVEETTKAGRKAKFVKLLKQRD